MVEARVEVPLTVSAVADALESVVCPDTCSVVAVVVARVEVPVTLRVPPTVWLPTTVDVPSVAVFAVR